MTGPAIPRHKAQGLAAIFTARLFAALAMTALVCLTSSADEAQSRDERAVRAAYVYNLIKYVDWPVPQKDLTIAFAGDATTGDVIVRMLDGKTTNSQTIRAVLWTAAAESPRPSVLYIADPQEANVRRYLEQAQGRGVLTIGETEDFTRSGGMVALVNTGDHIRIEVNLDAVQAAGIRISSRVLELATIVRPAGKAGN